MARTNIPNEYNEQTSLFKDIQTKDANDGAASEIRPFLVENGIDLAVDAAAVGDANHHEDRRADFQATADVKRGERDEDFEPVWKVYTDGCQFLKSFYKHNPQLVEGWGIIITDSGKILHPAAFKERAAKVIALLDKHDSFPAGASPLGPFLITAGATSAATRTTTEDAATAHDDFSVAEGQAQNERQLRDNAFAPVLGHVRGIADNLKRLHAANPLALNAWGYSVIETPAAPRERVSDIKLGQQVTINSARIGGLLTNIGDEPVHVFKGSTATGDAIVVPPGGELGILKGMSVLTIVNPSTLRPARVKVLRSGSEH